MNRRKTIVSALAACTFALLPFAYAQKKEAKPATAPQNAAQIELLETKYRFETNGDSRKEVHARVRINNELGVRQFARLKFDYNRRFQSVEIPLVRVTHPSGGTADILPSAIADNPNPAVVDFPAYHDVREKSVRILGLAPGDLLEYRVITTTTHPPLAPDFWLDHSFDRTGVVSHEIFSIDLPASRFEPAPPKPAKSYPPTESDPLGISPPLNESIPQFVIPGAKRSGLPGRIRISPTAPQPNQTVLAEGETKRLIYRWDLASSASKSSGNSANAGDEPDIAISTFATWSDLAVAMGGDPTGQTGFTTADLQRLRQMAGPMPSGSPYPQVFYDFVSRKIATVNLPFDTIKEFSAGPFETLKRGYGTPYAKFVLFRDLAYLDHRVELLFFASGHDPDKLLPSPSAFSRLLIEVPGTNSKSILDPGVEVAPYGLLSANIRGGKALRFRMCAVKPSECWLTVPLEPPFPSKQRVTVASQITQDGTLSAKVHYQMRGDNELLLRVAFHQTPKEKWKDVAQLLALSDGFRGKVTKVTASDPYETTKPFEVEYDVEQPKFVNWEKKPVRIPAILPLVGLPDPPAPGAATIELGTPLDVDLQATIKLPPGTTARVPTGTSVARDYAEFSSSYSAQGEILTASRKIRFLLRTLPADRAMDYNAFLRAVQNDQAQEFALEPPAPEPKRESAKLGRHAH